MTWEDYYEDCIELRKALSEAIKEVQEHNSEYHHITANSKIEEWKKLL